MSGNSNLLRPIAVPPQTIEEITKKLTEATVKILGTSGPANTIVLVRDMIMPELTIAAQAMIDAITPGIAASGEWYIGDQPTGIMAGNFVKSPDGSVWTLTTINNDGTAPIFSKVYDPNA